MSWWSEYNPHITESAFWDFFDHEQRAGHVRAYECLLVPALLQTEAYARSVLSEFYTDHDQIEALVRLRMERQRRFAGRQTYVIDEAVLHNVMGTAEVMRSQLARLLKASARDDVTLRVVSRATSNPNFCGSLWLFENGDGADDALYLERTPSGSTFTGSAAEIAENRARFEEFSGKALDDDRSLKAIKRARKKLR